MLKLKYLILTNIPIMCLTTIFNCSYAIDTAGIKNYFSTPKTGLPSTTTMGQTLFATFTTIGYILAVAVLLITAIEFITANAQKRAMLKEKLWLILIGVIILAGGLPILQLVANIMEQAGQSL